MRRTRASRGFSIIELAIVLVIIGLILGAILKGQDLIQSARIKKFVAEAGTKWETALWTYYDRNGRLPSDANKDGIAGDGNANTDLNSSAAYLSPPVSAISVGPYNFVVMIGHSGETPDKNVLVICKTSACTVVFTLEELEFLRAFDTSFDGLADGTTGQVRSITAATGTSAANWTVATSVTTGVDWSVAATGLAYYFDRKKP